MQSFFFNKKGASEKLPDAAISIMFSVDNYNAKVSDADIAIIDNFFDTMQFQTPTPADDTKWTSTAIPFANMLNLVDWSNRWVYKGSVTTPPCGTGVYWNVLANVYPIK